MPDRRTISKNIENIYIEILNDECTKINIKDILTD